MIYVFSSVAALAAGAGVVLYRKKGQEKAKAKKRSMLKARVRGDFLEEGR